MLINNIRSDICYINSNISMAHLCRRSLPEELHVGGQDHSEAPVQSLCSYLSSTLWRSHAVTGRSPPQHIIQTLYLLRPGAVSSSRSYEWIIVIIYKPINLPKRTQKRTALILYICITWEVIAFVLNKVLYKAIVWLEDLDNIAWIIWTTSLYFIYFWTLSLLSWSMCRLQLW